VRPEGFEPPTRGLEARRDSSVQSPLVRGCCSDPQRLVLSACPAVALWSACSPLVLRQELRQRPSRMAVTTSVSLAMAPGEGGSRRSHLVPACCTRVLVGLLVCASWPSGSGSGPVRKALAWLARSAKPRPQRWQRHGRAARHGTAWRLTWSCNDLLAHNGPLRSGVIGIYRPVPFLDCGRLLERALSGGSRWVLVQPWDDAP